METTDKNEIMKLLYEINCKLDKILEKDKISITPVSVPNIITVASTKSGTSDYVSKEDIDAGNVV